MIRRGAAIRAAWCVAILATAGCGQQHAGGAGATTAAVGSSAGSLKAIDGLPQGSKAGVYLPNQDEVDLVTMGQEVRPDPKGVAKRYGTLDISRITLTDGKLSTHRLPVADSEAFGAHPVIAASAAGTTLWIGAGRDLVSYDPTTESANAESVPADLSPLPPPDSSAGGIAAVASIDKGAYLVVTGSDALLKWDSVGWTLVADLPLRGWFGSKIIVRDDGSLVVSGYTGDGPAAIPAVASATDSSNSKFSLADGLSTCLSGGSHEVCLTRDSQVVVDGATSVAPAGDALPGQTSLDLSRDGGAPDGALWYWFEEQSRTGQAFVCRFDAQADTLDKVPVPYVTADTTGVSRVIPPPSGASSTSRLAVQAEQLVPVSATTAVFLTYDGEGQDGVVQPPYAGAYIVQTR